MPELVSVKEISRGVDWVKFLATWRPGVTFSQIEQWHDAWSKKHSGEFECGIALVMPFSFGDDRAIFKFRTEPYSMKSNECYRYIDAFDKSLRGPGVSSENPLCAWLDAIRHCGTTGVLDTAEIGDRFVVPAPPNDVSTTVPKFRTTNDVRVKSLISRIKGRMSAV